MMKKFMDKLKTSWIIFRCAISTVKTIFTVFFLGIFNKPEKIDKALQRWSMNLLHILKVNWRVLNPAAVSLKPGEKYIIMSNHASLIDIPLIFAAMPGKVRMLAKKELFAIPLYGKAMKIAGFPAIDRKNINQALKDMEMVKTQMAEGIVPWIAPEGTRSRDGKLQMFKKGGFMIALQTGAAIIPISIRGAANIIPPDTFSMNLHQSVEIEIHPPIAATEYSVESRNDFVRAVRDSIARGLGDANE